MQVKGFRTIIVAVIAGLLALLQTNQLIDLFPGNPATYLPGVIAVLMVIMRFFTDSKVGNSQ